MVIELGLPASESSTWLQSFMPPPSATNSGDKSSFDDFLQLNGAKLHNTNKIPDK